MKKLITLCTLLLCAVVTSWADAYDVTYDEVIILKDVYDANATGEGYSSHSAIAWGGTASTNSKKAGDPANNGEATSSNVNCYSVKGNGKGKNITVSVKNCSKIIVYHEKHSSRYVELRSGNKDGGLIGKGAANTYYTEVALDDTETYTIFLHGTTGSDDQDLNVYAVKLFAPAAVNPVFSLTATTIGLDETSRIQVGAKGNLDGIALTGLASSDPTVATVDETGMITPKKIGTTTISFTASAAVDGKYNATSTTFSEKLTVTAPVVDTPVISPANGTYFLGNQSVTIACSTDGAAIQYSTDGGSSWNNYTGAFDISATTTILVKATKDGYTESAQATATINKLVPAELTAVSENTTWDWTGWDKELKLTAETAPDENTTMTFSDIALVNGLTLPSGFNGNAITFKGQYPVRSKKSQAGTWTVKTTVAGRFEITFSDTGSSGTGVKRYLNVNGVNTEYYTQRDGSSSDKKTVTLKLPAGTYAFTGMGEDEATPQAIVMYKIVFTAVPEVSATINASGYNTYSTNYPVDLSTITNGTAYIATDAAGGKVTLTKCEAKVPAATGLLIAGEAGTKFQINTTADATEAPAGNLLVGMPNGGAVPAGKYVFAWPNTDPTAASFYRLDDVLADIGEFKAYLDTDAVGGARLSLSFGEDAGEATGISEMKNVKADGTIFNLRGQRVAQPQKGLYILNGKKTIVK